MLKPTHFVVAARVTLVLGGLSVAVLALGPFQGAERIVGLNDKAAHAIAFGGLLAVSFLAFPRMRRNDLAIAALVLGAGVEVAQLFGGRSASLLDWLADAAGVLTIYGASMIETVRKMVREQGDMTFAEIAAADRRRARRRAPAVFTPLVEAPRVEPAPQLSFAQRAARRFPVR
ncbi:VanZ family protein [Caulobacter sp. SL161]|uniref:VanZ family protein n=1 Tax=Caulobacter sp. SL161 TaxID=2995156 RepID=UPI0022767143|nr:VanZ family protein [Caulobacter sp. SL161]MCY1648217.1 VanZ family protein [Caulobacter sp. SL161]